MEYVSCSFHKIGEFEDGKKIESFGNKTKSSAYDEVKEYIINNAQYLTLASEEGMLDMAAEKSR